MSSSYLDNIPMGPPDAILGIVQAFRSCEDPNKVNVCIGAYRDANGKPWVLPSVRQAELVFQEENKEYLPIEGDVAFVEKALTFAYGQEAPLERIAGVQSLSGTGACRIGGAFLGRFLPKGTKIYIPDPTWGNHLKIFAEAGLVVERYRYYNRATNGLNLKGLLEDIGNAPDDSVVLLHACAHNPTGCDPTHDEWKTICKLIQSKHQIAFFDSAYQGFASGNAEQDAWALRYFVSQNVPVLLAQSFAKNFGLYGERCGTLSIICDSPEQREKVMSQLRLVIRPMYSNPPKHGSSIVRTILSDEKLTAQYYTECKIMADRIAEMRTKLVSTLEKVGSTHDWSHVTNQIGMFAYTGCNQEMCDILTEKYAIFLTKDGRISIAGLNDANVEYVAKAIYDVTEGKPITLEE
jgi:aspartate aminotransferase